eukprot:scaffold302_cov247-Pinguiococcus_pyrenoidosus.AAC.33
MFDIQVRRDGQPGEAFRTHAIPAQGCLRGWSLTAAKAPELSRDAICSRRCGTRGIGCRNSGGLAEPFTWTNNSYKGVEPDWGVRRLERI